MNLVDTVHLLFPTLDIDYFADDGTIGAGNWMSMTGSRRKAELKRMGVKLEHTMHFLRAIQQMTASFPSNELAVGAKQHVHQLHSANSWQCDSSRISLFGLQHVCSSIKPKSESVTSASPVQYLQPNSPCAPSGFPNGIRNQGSTCYLNSLIQALFHLPKFRSAIYNLPADDEGSEILLALQKLFYSLQVGNTPAETTELTAAFGWSSRDAFVQHDIHELTRILLDNLEEKLKRAGHPNIIQELFLGSQESFVEAKEANYRSSRKEPFYDLALVVKDCDSIYKSFEKLLERSILDGENKYCLETDGKKSYYSAEMGTKLVELPPVLLLHLARFDYDPLKDDLCKILSRWEYYGEIDLSKYVEDNRAQYQLHAVVVHLGSGTRCGHYFCYVRVKGEWMEFNDDCVKVVGRAKVFGDNFGGSKTNYWGQAEMLTRNAYMLVYIRSGDADEVLAPVESIPDRLRELVEQENAAAQQKARERAEDHLYLQIHLVTAEEIKQSPDMLCSSSKAAESQTTLRVLRSSTAKDIQSEIEDCLKISVSQQSLWTRNPNERFAFKVKISPYSVLQEFCAPYQRSLPILVLRQENPPSTHCAITHHKVYDPVNWKAEYVGSLCTSESEVRVLLPEVREMAGELFSNFNGKLGVEVFCQLSQLKFVVQSGELHSGDIFVWQQNRDTEEVANLMYPTVLDYERYLNQRTTVHLHLNDPPKYPLVQTCELALDMTYGQLQQYVGRLIKLDEFDKIRFSRHNAETQCPFFMKIKKKDKSTLRTLLTVGGAIVDKMYYEVGQFTVTTLEEGNPLSFEYVDEHLVTLSNHTLLMPSPGTFTVGEMLDICAEALGLQKGTPMRLIDVWKGKMYQIFEDREQLVAKAFEEASEYRLEKLPSMLPDVDLSDQTLVHVQHFEISKGRIKTHSFPFSLYIHNRDGVEEVQNRIAKKLKKTVQEILPWRLCLVRRLSEKVKIEDSEPVAKQYLANARYLKKDEEVHSFLGMEHHEPPTTRRVERVVRGLQINN